VRGLPARRQFLAAVLGLFALPQRAAAKEVSGVVLADKARLEGGAGDVKLLGGGVFRFFFLRYYVCGLYAAEGLSDADAILGKDAPRRVQLVALKRITSFEFLWGLDKGLADNMAESEAKALHAPLEQVRATIRAIGAIAPGARVSIDYAPLAGTSILVDEHARAAPVAGKLLSDALLRVWIGERPLDTSLKKALLGG
jgi:hypothetical protein